ncbi:prepilin-type N-terminal cleavage/methylation domain-containing protein [Candidatus Kaiserbacteria bacterium]|nr:prepilin-type N-terminal cleavage/methylation domain-containing protein [Candidatus Kaiserbacteria bacterium]
MKDNLIQSQERDELHQCSGFTLVELMVSVSIFAVVMLISVGSLIVLVDANAKAQSLHGVMSNLSFAIDNITRDLRVGRDYYCGTLSSTLPSSAADCVNGSGIAFTDGRTGERIGYRLSSGALEQKVDDGSWLPITSTSVVIQTFLVTVSGTGSTDGEQPQASLALRGYVSNGIDTETDFDLQAQVTQRRIDLE